MHGARFRFLTAILFWRMVSDPTPGAGLTAPHVCAANSLHLQVTPSLTAVSMKIIITLKLIIWHANLLKDYTCKPTDTPGICHVTAAAQTSLVVAKQQLATALPPGRIWETNSSTPYFYYTDANKVMHRVDYDDSESQ
jgi:hypothetical protein